MPEEVIIIGEDKSNKKMGRIKVNSNGEIIVTTSD